ncbi:NAD(P)-dependent dehydrogenase (short-subunit alcohol dehydrogenase family) [Rhodobium orientis]|uniref:Oxidoreductase n=1 Tax=Rhodobium orientis TaxID=34017 RepID=A0A327JR39_9HYPH|nr:SDR family NAD(P)-dependent oxidoreductase [Rhodobium orientis]MBB4302230.1 NAD(P)-dependent dehydrogenase (short-subunit alcohol dehydrogenase family) [Rhodobium orientis]MBK5948941.1 oxidoreductase [Rhodobium orientis]RAI28940.1 oxidoreductase [Rhodobium orientis]
MTKPFADKIAVVTGASRGIGYFTAKALAEAGAHVIAVARTEGGLTDLDDEIREAGGSATLVPLDLTDYDALDRLGATIYERWGKLDILVGNAGLLGELAPLGHIEIKTWEQTLAVNVTANWRLIRSFDPLFKRSEAARIAFMTSGAAHKCRAFWGIYSVSKAALEALARTYAEETRNSPTRVNLFNPGPVRTGMRARAMPGEDPETLPHPSELAPAILDLVSPSTDVTGKIFDYPTGTFLTPGMPTPDDAAPVIGF